jgi:predicted PurR-regulated permease PerM
MNLWRQMTPQHRKRFALWALSALVVIVTLWLARKVLGLYLIGLVLAYILAPVVDGVQHGIEWFSNQIRFGFLHKRARGLGIFISYLLLIGVIAGFFAIAVPIIVNEAEELWSRREVIWHQIRRVGENVGRNMFEQYQLLPDQVRAQVDEYIQNINTYVGNVLQRVLEQALQATGVAITLTTSIVLGITIVPFWTYYFLRDYTQIRDSLESSIPRAIRADVRSVLLIVDRTVGAYVRGQFVLATVVGTMTAIVVSILGLEYGLLLGVIAGALEVVPNIGPTLASIPAILLALTRSPGLAIITAISYNLIQNVENSLIVPRVLGRTMGLHPVVMMVMLVVGAEIAGLLGLILAPIITALLRDLYRYLSYRFADDPLTPAAALAQLMNRVEFDIDV